MGTFMKADSRQEGDRFRPVVRIWDLEKDEESDPFVVSGPVFETSELAVERASEIIVLALKDEPSADIFDLNRRN